MLENNNNNKTYLNLEVLKQNEQKKIKKIFMVNCFTGIVL